MIPYILECLVFQLLFLGLYDLFLKRETFYQWNRAYLIGTHLLSMVLPWIKIQALQDAMPQEFGQYPEYLWTLNQSAVAVTGATNTSSWFANLSTEEYVYGSGVFLAFVFFIIKLRQLFVLRKQGEIKRFSRFTQVIIKKSNQAFSFFSTIFMGEQIVQKDYPNILEHELVHIEQRHSIDLLFFELLRIITWFNPMVYLYQKRISELHEFIADAKVAKAHKKEQYQFLLSQVFETQQISFINPFFKSSLIKKRIVMLQKSKSQEVLKLKYLMLLPLLLGMLTFTSLKGKERTVVYQEKQVQEKPKTTDPEPLEEVVIVGSSSTPSKKEKTPSSIKKVAPKKKVSTTVTVQESIPFAVVEQVPVFPGCEDAKDPRACFSEKVQMHIRNNFSYPAEAQQQNIQGRVSLLFTISSTGDIVNIRKRGPSPLLEEEAVRIIELLPKMTPGYSRGQAVNVPYSIPINFKLEGDFSSVPASTTEVSDTEPMPFVYVDIPPLFPNCQGAEDAKTCFNEEIDNHIKKYFYYPKEAQKKGIEGRVSAVFTVDKEGQVSNIKVRGPHKLLEDTVVDILSKLPKMTAAVKDGKEIAMVYSVPVTFALP